METIVNAFKTCTIGETTINVDDMNTKLRAAYMWKAPRMELVEHFEEDQEDYREDEYKAEQETELVILGETSPVSSDELSLNNDYFALLTGFLPGSTSGNGCTSRYNQRK